MVVKTAKKYIGYLEHLTDNMLGMFTANIGKGGHTIFAFLIGRAYKHRDFTGLPWCATFVHAVFIEALGKENARRILGRPHPGTKVLARRMKSKGWIRGKTYVPKTNDIIFMHNGDGKISHVGIVEYVDGDTVISIEGNTVDPTGRFQPKQGGAVARRQRKLTHPAIVGYAELPLNSEVSKR